MLDTTMLYSLTAAALFVMGLYALLAYPHLLRKILGMNVMGVGVFMLFIAQAYPAGENTPDPVPHALVLTGIVVAVCATALALNLAFQLEAVTRSFDLTEEDE
jgi:multicomponent Na+:H+ antiporter subunit C